MILPETRPFKIGGVSLGGLAPFTLIAGPCVIESREVVFEAAERLAELTSRLGVPFVFKASFDKANRSSIEGFRGPGMKKGLALLAEVREKFNVPVISDIHERDQAAPAGEALDAIQIPAFLCRQTDLLVAAGKTGKPVNIKKGQFMAPSDMVQAARKVESAGNDKVSITERGVAFGYHNLVVDMRSLAIVRSAGYPVVFDATHSVQLPASRGTSSGGDRRFVPLLARAAAAAGVDAVFMETHPDPDRARCDGPNSVPLDQLENIIQKLVDIDRIVKSG